MFDLNNLPDDIGETLHEAFKKAFHEGDEHAEESPQEDDASGNSRDKEELNMLKAKIALLCAQCYMMQGEINGLRKELDDARADELRRSLAEDDLEDPLGEPENGLSDGLHTAGIAGLLAAPMYGISHLILLGLRRLACSWLTEDTIFASVLCVLIGLLLLVLSFLSSDTRHEPLDILSWLDSDDPKDKPSEEKEKGD